MTEWRQAARDEHFAGYEEQVRQRLQDATIECVREVGLDKVTMRGIGERAGLVRQTVYNYYRNKNQLLADAFNREGTRLALAIADHIRGVESAEDQFIEAFLYVVEHFPRNPILALLLDSGTDFLRLVGMSYYPFSPFGQLAFAELFREHPSLAVHAEEISEFWARNALSFLTLRGATERSREELAAYARRRLIPGLHL